MGYLSFVTDLAVGQKIPDGKGNDSVQPIGGAAGNRPSA